MKGKTRLVLLLGIMLIFTACSVEEKENESTIGNLNEEGHITEKLDDNLYIDMDVSQSWEQEYAIYSAKEKTFTKDDIQLFISEDAIQLGKDKINEVLDCQAVEPVEIKVVSMGYKDVERLEKEYKYEANEKKLPERQWSQDDDVYYIQYALKLNNLLFHTGIDDEPVTMKVDVTANFPTNVTVLIGNDGIRAFIFRNALDGLDNIKEMKPIISSEEAIEKVINNYNNIILTNKTTISKI